MTALDLADPAAPAPPPAPAQAAPVLLVDGLSVAFRTRGGIVRALDRVGFTLHAGETLALVGESGSGKSVTAFALLGLLDAAGQVTAGRAVLEGMDLATASPRVMAGIRGRRAAMVFQNPRAALNPIRPDWDADRRRAAPPCRAGAARPRLRAPSTCCAPSASPTRPGARGPTRSSSRAACASAWSSPSPCPPARRC